MIVLYPRARAVLTIPLNSRFPIPLGCRSYTSFPNFGIPPPIPLLIGLAADVIPGVIDGDLAWTDCCRSTVSPKEACPPVRLSPYFSGNSCANLRIRAKGSKLA